ncbi:NLR family CARD domain-containing protein 4-like [Amphiura filiformis]|uniref:NLR family CARD domain-containing protein 4-like n=1 Tax=Amphiura filiformis TaxID=82378 RepID=UPI003B226598
MGFFPDPLSTRVKNQAFSGPHRHLQPNQPPDPAPHLPQIHRTSQLHSYNYSSPQSSLSSTACITGLQQPISQFHHQTRHVTGEGVPSYPVQSSSFDLSNVSHRVESDYPPVRQLHDQNYLPKEQLGAQASSCYHHPFGRNTSLEQQAHVIPPIHGPVSQSFRQNSPQMTPDQHIHHSQSLPSIQIETSPTASSGQQGYHHPLGRNTTLQQQAHVIPPIHGPVSQSFCQNSPQMTPDQHIHHSQSLSSTQIETSPTTSSGQQVYTSPVFNLAECKKELVKYYRHEMRRVQLLPWCDESRDMNDIYVTLKLQNRSGKGRTQLTNNEDLVCIKSSQNEPETRILLKGVAGSGKSTLLAKLAYTWAEQKNGSPLANFELLFILSLREVKNRSLIVEIFEQIFETNTKVSKDGLTKYIESHPQSIILLLDGFDEYSASDLSNPVGSLQEILTFKSFRDCYTILSTRPHKDLQNYQSSYVVVDVLGFSRKNVKLYMQRFFNGNIDMAQGLQQRIKESERLIYLSKIPVILMLMCLLWEDGQKLPDTQTELYQEFIFFLWRKYCTRRGKKVNLKSKTDGEFEQFISRLGEVALDGLCSIQNIEAEKIVFTDNDFEDSFQLGCETGLLSRERLRSKLSTQSAVTFLHKSFQEFCAAKYWTNLYTTGPHQFSQILSRFKSWTGLMSKFDLIKFCFGLVEKSGLVLITRFVISLYRNRQRLNSCPSDIRIGYNKPEGSTKNIINILTLLYESQDMSDGGERVDDTLAHLKIRQHYQGKRMSKTTSFDPPANDCITDKSHHCGALNSSLGKAFKLIFPDDGFTIAVANKYPKAISMFHNFVRSELGFSILSTVKSIGFENPHLSMLVVGDTLRCMSNVEDVKFEFSEVDNNHGNVQYDLGKQIHPSVKSINLFNPHLSVSFVTDILRYISNVHDVSVTFSEYDPIDQLGVMLTDKQCLTKLLSLKLTLDKLKGDHIKILNEYLPKVSNLQELNMNVSNIYPRMAVGHLVKQLQYCSKLTSLNLTDSKLEEEHIKILSEHLPKISNLQKLNMSCNTVGMAIKSLVKPLQHCPELNILNLSNSQLKEEHIKILSEFLPKVSSLQQLDVSQNNVGIAIKSLMQQLQYCTKLTSLNLFDTQLKEDHIQILSEPFPRISTLHELNVSRNTVGMTIGSLAQQLQYCTELTSLNLSNTELKEDHIKILSELFPKVTNLQELNVSENIVGLAIESLAQQLQYCTKLTSLNLDNTQLKEDHIEILSEFLPKISNLQELYVARNSVGMAIGPLAQQLQFCPMLSKLNLSNAHIPDEGVIELSQRFVSMPNLTHLDLWPGYGSIFGSLAVDALFEHIHHLTKLQYLHFNYGPVSKCSDRVKDCFDAIGNTIQDYIVVMEMNHEEVQLVQDVASKYHKN